MPGGPEDIAVDPRGGFYASVSDWRGRQKERRAGRGAIFRLERDASGRMQKSEVTPASLRDFQPHGIDLWTGPDGAQRLFVVNHPLNGPSRVEIFAVTPEGLIDTGEGGAWKKLHRPNDLAAFGPRSFFATNDHTIPREGWFDPTIRESASDIGGEGNGYLVRVDDGRLTIVARRLSLANGVALSPDRRKLYVAESTMGRIRVFGDLQAPSLRELDRLDPGPGPDNITVDAAGDLWIGAHNNGLDFLRHAMNGERPSPGRVVRLTPGGAKTIVYQSGREANRPETQPRLWSVSVGAPDEEGRVIVGAIFPHEVQVCRLADRR
jgi:arylesterase/paraoxonase